MKTIFSKVALLGIVLAIGTATSSTTAMADNGRSYQVTITNAMHGQPLAPSVIATHDHRFQLFELGAAPMAGDSGYADYFALAAMAETGYPFHVLDQVSDSQGVWEAVALPPLLPPGESNSVVISASGKAKLLSAVGMLGKTNDAVYAARGIELPRGVGQSVHAYANVYDVGSEANAESTATIGALGSTEDDGASGTGIDDGSGEGYIHIHAGVHGVGGTGGLSPATDDWRNPAVLVTIEHIK